MPLGDAFADLRLAVRGLRRSPLFAAVAVLSLAVAIGANATIFGLVDAVLWKPLPGSRTTPLVSVFTSESDGNGYGVNSYAAYEDLRAEPGVFAHIGASCLTPMLHAREDHADKVLGMLVSGDWFGTLGVAQISADDPQFVTIVSGLKMVYTSPNGIG